MNKYDRKDEINEAKRRIETWFRKAKEPWDIYSKKSILSKHCSNSLWWSIIESIKPHLYFQQSPIHIQRRISKKNPVNLAAATLAENATEFMLDSQDFDSCIERVVLDYLLTGRGVPWVTFEPKIEEVILYAEPVDNNFALFNNTLIRQSEFQKDSDGRLFIKQKQLTKELVKVVRIHPKNYIEGRAEQPDDIEWKGRFLDLDEEAVKQKFGSKIAKSLIYSKSSFIYENRTEQQFAPILELWDRQADKVCYYQDDKLIESEKPNIDFQNFFPCPQALTGTCPEDSCDPISEYFQIKSHLDTLDILNLRQQKLAEKIRVAGGYNGTFSTILSHILSGKDDSLYPLEDWPTFAQTGGIEGNIAILPFERISTALQAISQEILAVKNNIYEIVGVSDLIRGVGDPRATATAEQIKGDFVSVRLEEKRKFVSRMVRDTIRLVTEATVEKLTQETFLNISGADLNDSNTQAAYQLLQNDKFRTFAIEIETEATLKIDERQDKEQAVEFVGQFQSAMAMFAGTLQTTPWLAEATSEAVMLLLRKYKAGRGFESKIESSLEQAIIQQAQMQQQQPPPDPQKELADAMIRLEQSKLEVDAAKLQLQEQKLFLDAQKQNVEKAKTEFEIQQKMAEIAQKQKKLEVDNEKTSIEIAKIESDIHLSEQDMYLKEREQKRKETETAHDVNLQQFQQRTL